MAFEIYKQAYCYMPVLFGMLVYMEQGQKGAQPAEDERYKKFADGRRQFSAELGERTLDVAKEGKAAKEKENEWGAERIEEHKKAVERVRDDIDSKKQTVISKIMNFKKLRELKKELSRNETVLQKSEEEQKWRDEMIGYYDQIIGEEEKLGALMEEAQADNIIFDENKKAELIEEEKGRSVMDRAKKNNVFFVSDIIDADWKPSENNRALDTKNLDFEDQLNIVLGLDPTLAVSTLSPDSKNRTFGDGAMGVLLSGGRITGGEPTDAGTVAMGLRSRAFHNKNSYTVGAIDKAIEGRHDGKTENSSYNELAVESPEVAGIYFKLMLAGSSCTQRRSRALA